MIRETSLTVAQFEEMLDNLPSLQWNFKTPEIASDSLHMYLMKLRTGMPLSDIALKFHVSAATVCTRLRKIRKVLLQDFVGPNLTAERSREDLINHTTIMGRILFGSPEMQNVILTLDGTYIFVDKSSNYSFQRDTYNKQKSKNFVRIMMCVATDGFIVHALGPFKARDNDAKCLVDIFENTNKLQSLRAGDALILDRGFRDCVDYLKRKGFDVKMPALIQNSANERNSANEDNSPLLKRITLVWSRRFGLLWKHVTAT